MREWVLAEQNHAFIRSQKWEVAVLPFGATEPHNLHMPYGTDNFEVDAVSQRACERAYKAGARVLLLPTIPYGVNTNHLQVKGALALSVTPTTLLKALADLVDSLERQGLKKLVLLNGHGGNIDTMHLALRRLQPRYRGRILTAASYWELADKELVALAKGSRKEMGHACEFETSMMLALRPELVRREEIKDDPPQDEPALRGVFVAEDMKQRTDHGAVGYPECASAEQGRAFLAAAVERAVEVVRVLLQRRLPE